MSGRRFLVPEVIQTSAMDCGPAALKCLLEGLGVRATYGRLREACQTDVDGSSIDTLEDLANQLGVEAEQVMLPIDHVLADRSHALPCIAVVRRSDGATHFVVLWRRHGGTVQVMDPASGRRWPSGESFLEELYVHETRVTSIDYRAWAGSAEFLDVLRRRMTRLGITEERVARLVEAALEDESWPSLAALDASVRMTAGLVRSDGIRKGREAASVCEALFHRARRDPEGGGGVPPVYWAARRPPAGTGAENEVLLRGAVLVRALGRRVGDEAAGSALPSPALRAAVEEPPPRVARTLLRMLREDGALSPLVLMTALLVSCGFLVLEAFLFRGLVDLGRELSIPFQRVAALGVLLVLGGALLAVEQSIASGALRMGRHLEARLRLAFLRRIPELPDRYFRSRLASDLAERGHGIHSVRMLPDTAEKVLRCFFQIILTSLALAWIAPESAGLALLLGGLQLVLALVAVPVVNEQDLRTRGHAGALSHFYLDALLGVVTVQAHGAENGMQREHDRVLSQWARAGLALQRTVASCDALQAALGYALAVLLIVSRLRRIGDEGEVLLVAFWGLDLVALGLALTFHVRQYPGRRNATLRLLEPLGSPGEAEDLAAGASSDDAPDTTRSAAPRGAALRFDRVHVQITGRPILENITLVIEPGNHVAIVGPSGAGKSTLVGMLLGWLPPSEGSLLVDGAPLTSQSLDQLRLETAWVDPAIQVWNRSLLQNLRYGADGEDDCLARILDDAELIEVLERLPDGLSTPLGESGGLVSGGEGQRVRLGRALLRRGVRLAILDEPFRGLDRERRGRLLDRARAVWKDATLLCVTHDISETRAFDRVLVMEEGRLVEDGSPAFLCAKNGAYRRLFEAENTMLGQLSGEEGWRLLRLDRGRLMESASR